MKKKQTATPVWKKLAEPAGTVTITAVAIWAALVITAAFAFGAGGEQTVKRAANEVALPGVNMKSVEMNESLGLYEVATESGTLFYLTRDMKYLIMGSVYEVNGMKNLTEARKADLFRVDFSSLPLTNAVKVSDGSRKVAVFGSPECPWCRKFHQELKRLKDTAVYVFLVPYGDPDRIRSAWCAGDAATLDRAYAGEKIETKVGTCREDVIAENGRLAKKWSIGSYPTVVFENGTRTSGFVTADRLENEMVAKQARATGRMK